MKGMGVNLVRNREWDWPVLATNRSTGAARFPATKHDWPLVFLSFFVKPGLRTVKGMGFFPEHLLG